MARLARKQLADQRALEEESFRVALHGSGKYIGRGGVPSMGLSQFRGGCEECSSDEEDDYEEEEMPKKRGGRRQSKKLKGVRPRRVVPHEAVDVEGGRSFISRIPYARNIGLPRITRPTLPLAQQGVGIGRYVPPTRPPTAFPRPNIYSGRQFVGPRLVNPPRRITSAVNRLGLEQGRRAPTVFNARNAGRISALLSAGIPLAMLGAYLGDMGADSGGGDYYDDYAGEIGGPAGGPTGGPSGGPSGGPAGGPDADGDGIPDSMDPDGGAGGLPADIADQLSDSELAFYLQSGNLPSRFYQQSKRGKGMLKIQHGGKKRKPSARNEIVKRVMRERGVSLPEASKIVKAEGLY